MEIESVHIIVVGSSSALFVLGLFILSKCYYTVTEGNHAVLTRFGGVLRESQQKKENMRIIPEGLHFKLPWDRVLYFSKMEKLLDLSGPSGGQYSLTADGTLLRLDARIRLTPKSSQLYSYLFDLDNPLEHIRDLFICLLRNEIANFTNEVVGNDADAVGSYDLIRRHRQILNERMGRICETLGEKYGVEFQSVDLIDILPPPELEKALNGILHAQTQAETRLMRAEAECNQKKEAANRNIQISKFHAHAEISHYRIIVQHLEKLKAEGTLDDYLEHKRNELIAASKLRIVETDRGI